MKATVPRAEAMPLSDMESFIVQWQSPEFKSWAFFEEHANIARDFDEPHANQEVPPPTRRPDKKTLTSGAPTFTHSRSS